MNFRKDFIFGAATAAYQVEGAAFEDGKGKNIWDVYSHQPGRIRDNHNGDIACDHYHRFKEDVQIMKEMGIKAYRLSTSWSRIYPEGTGTVNQKGVEFYDRLIEELLKNDITPFITLYHWDLPYELYKKGGWLNRDIVHWFGEYTKFMTERYSDRVKHWITINEPQCFIGHGMQTGKHAPFERLPERDILTAAHHVLLSHGNSVQILRDLGKQELSIGYAPVGCVKCPKSNRTEDINAARNEMFRSDRESIFNAAWWSDPIFFGKYPEDGLAYHEPNMPEIRNGDMELIHQPLDFYGVNIYTAGTVEADDNGNVSEVKPTESTYRTAFDWVVKPEALYWGSRFLYERYKKPILITENGMANTDWIMEDGRVHDPQRIDFLQKYIKALEKSYEDGTDVMGYFQWSLMDNFEWAEGYYKRFGLIYVDYETQRRVWKDSAYWYRDMIKEFYKE